MLKLLASLLLSCCIALGVSLSPAAAMGVYDLPILSSGAPTYVVDPVAAISAANEGKLNKDLKNSPKKPAKK